VLQLEATTEARCLATNHSYWQVQTSKAINEKKNPLAMIGLKFTLLLHIHNLATLSSSLNTIHSRFHHPLHNNMHSTLLLQSSSLSSFHHQTPAANTSHKNGDDPSFPNSPNRNLSTSVLDSGSSWLDGVNGILMQQEPNLPKQD
jgi:hypothetical protein